MRSASDGDTTSKGDTSRWPSTRTWGGEPTLMWRSDPRCSTVKRKSSFRSSITRDIGVTADHLKTWRRGQDRERSGQVEGGGRFDHPATGPAGRQRLGPD